MYFNRSPLHLPSIIAIFNLMQYHHPHTMNSDAFEVIEVTSKRIACDGGGGVLGHPRVFLTIDAQADHVVCPYCSRTFVYHDHHSSH
jgi:uncharacterized Zn-finger protein